MSATVAAPVKTRKPPTTTVYRVEHAGSGLGPYNHFGWGKDVEIERMFYDHCDSLHPAPGEDGIDSLAIKAEHRFGFKDLDHLRTWFAGWLKPLADRGFVIQEYRVPIRGMLRGRKQVAFDRTRADLIATHDLTS